VVAPACLSCPITYSALAERLGVEGDVSLEIAVDEEGRVVEATVVRSDSEILRDLALRNVRRWRYRPATKGGVAGKVRLEVVVQFRLGPGS
jgi:protein TonB